MSKTLEHPEKNQVKPQNNPQKSNTDNLDLVRNILFGEQVKQTEKRGIELERLFEISIDSLRDETEKKFDLMSQELSTSINLLTDETKTRHAEFNHTRNTFNHLAHQIAQADIKNEKNQFKLHEKIIDESSKSNINIKRVNEELSLKLEHAVQQLRYEKADRKVVAGLLSGVAKQLLDGNENS